MTESDDDYVNNLFASLNTGPTASTTDKRVRKKKPRPAKTLLHPNAVAILTGITGSPSSDICNWLYKAEIVQNTSECYEAIHQYVINSQEHGFGIKVSSILRIIRNKDYGFKDDGTKRFRMMLWHGTKKSCVASILQKGFERPATKNQMFGTGIYFADRASKSARYCDGTGAGAVGHLFLCDVDLGRMYKAKNPHNDYTAPPTNFDTVKCVGENIPDWKQNTKIKKSIYPNGPTVKNTRFPKYTVFFNEYVVYHPERIKPKFLVTVNFQAAKCV